MKTDIHAYIEDLFKGYEETPELRDFKEEIISNLMERIEDLKKSGMNEDEAFTKAVGELGNITAIADEISKEKRKEVIGKMYIEQGTKVDWKHALGYVTAGGILFFGIISALTAYFATGKIFIGVSSLMPFLVISGSAFIFLGLTQETKRNYPMPWKRALLYALAGGTLLFGLNVSITEYLSNHVPSFAAIGTLIPFVIPAACVLGFLLLTEKKRHKPWVAEEQKILMERYAETYAQKYSNPEYLTARGLLSGALWIITIAAFALIWMIFSIKYAWIAIVLAIAFELLIELWFHTRKSE